MLRIQIQIASHKKVVRIPTSYSKDLRWRIIWMYLLQKKTIKEISRELYVNIRTIKRYIYLFYTTEDVSAKSQRHGPLPQMSEFEEITIIEMLLSKPSLYLREVQQELALVTGSLYDCATIYRTIKRLGMTRQ